MFFQIAQRYLIPGLVIQAVIVGGGYATGRYDRTFNVTLRYRW